MSQPFDTKPSTVQPAMQQYSTGTYSTGREHIVRYPPGFLAVRIIQLVCCLTVLGLCGFVVAAATHPTPGLGLSLFTSLSTMIVVIYYIVAQYGAPIMYNYWAVLALEIFHVIFWLIAFAALGTDVGRTIYDGYSDSGTGDIVACAGAAAGFGAACFILFSISLGIHGAVLHRHRAAGGHCMPVSMRRNYQSPGIAMVQQPAQVAETAAILQHQGMQQPQWVGQAAQAQQTFSSFPPQRPQHFHGQQTG